MKNKGVITDFKFTNKYARFDTTTYNGQCWFVNQQNVAQYTDGIEVRSLGGSCPAGKYIEVFYDHLVIGAPVVEGIAHNSRCLLLRFV